MLSTSVIRHRYIRLNCSHVANIYIMDREDIYLCIAMTTKDRKLFIYHHDYLAEADGALEVAPGMHEGVPDGANSVISMVSREEARLGGVICSFRACRAAFSGQGDWASAFRRRTYHRMALGLVPLHKRR